jgi:hypothetical protein
MCGEHAIVTTSLGKRISCGRDRATRAAPPSVLSEPRAIAISGGYLFDRIAEQRIMRRRAHMQDQLGGAI